MFCIDFKLTPVSMIFYHWKLFVHMVRFMEKQQDDEQLGAFSQGYSKKWCNRFKFFEQYGAPNTPTYRAGLKNLPLFQRSLMSLNLLAFAFSIIYFLILGLWRQALSLMGIGLLIGVGGRLILLAFGFELTSTINASINVVITVLWAMTANYAYYLKEVKGVKTWNPFKGIF